MLNLFKLIKKYRITFLLLGAILIGSSTGLLFSNKIGFFGDYLDTAILGLVFFIFLDVPFEKFLLATKKISFISIAWLTNFILIPIIGFTIAFFLFRNQPPVLIGLLIYFLFPCTDWFLAFTKIAGGDTVTGSVILPINLVTQIILYPLYLMLFARVSVGIPLENLPTVFIRWFLMPFMTATVIHFVIKKLLTGEKYIKIQKGYEYIIEGLLTIVVFIIFATNSAIIVKNLHLFFLIIMAVFFFFVTVYIVTEKISDLMKLPKKLRVLYTMTTSARNAPLMLAITTVAIPNQPLIYSTIIIGMLVEFPHLTVLTKILSKSKIK